MGAAMISLAPFEAFATDFFRIGYAGAVLLPAFYYHLASRVTRSEGEGFFVAVGYLAAGLLALSLWLTPSYWMNGFGSYSWGFFPKAGILLSWSLGLAGVLFLRILFLFIGAGRSSRGVVCARLRYLLASLPMFLFSYADFGAAYGWGIPPFGILFLLLAFGTAAYAVISLRLISADWVIKKGMLLTLLLSLLAGGFAGAAFFAGRILGEFNLPVDEYWIYGGFIFGAVLFYESLRERLIRVTDRYLFQKRFESERVLRDASRGMTQIESLDRLVKLVVYFSTMRMRVANAGVMLWDGGTESYRTACIRGYGRCCREPMPDEWGPLTDAHPLIRYLSGEREALEAERVREFLATGRGLKRHGSRPDYDFREILRKMESLRAVCVIPSFLGPQLRSVLFLGEKKSGESYGARDLDMLYTLAQESSIAVENARLYDEAMSKTQEIVRINQEHSEASRKLRLALEETEEANKKLRDAQAQLIHEQKMATLGRLAASVGHEVNNPLTILSMNISRMILKYRKDPGLRVADIADFFEKMESNIQRIKAVVNTLTGLLKKSEKGKFEPLSLKLVIEETLPLVQFQTYLDNLSGTEVEFNLPGNLPLIHGNLERLQEVFLNLFTNAYHAFSIERNDRRIQISAYVNESDPKRIHVDFTDNGSGIDEETVKKIFNYGFTTKGEGKGSGIGLYMCRYIIELHGGEIKVKSKKGEGTTFTLTLPVYDEGEKSDLKDFSKTAKA